MSAYGGIECPAARVTGTGCNWTSVTYMHAAGEIGKRKNKKKSEIKANEPGRRGKMRGRNGKTRADSRIGRLTKIYLITESA